MAVPRRRYPVMLVGLGARSFASTVRDIVERFHVPALVTYKAKGVIPDSHPWFAGVFTNAALERCVLDRADGFLTAGLDNVELLPRPWTYVAPMTPIEDFEGGVSDWTEKEVAELREHQRQLMRPAGQPGELLPHRVVELTAELYGGARVTVDAGAHMFAVMPHWPSSEPCEVLISNGLSTMGFALPSAIGACLLDPSQPVVAFTGDGGIMMCLGELRTAARERLPLRVLVFDDGDLSLISLKQRQRGYRTDGVAIGPVDWPAVALGMGVLGRTASSEEELADCLRETAGFPGPVLIAAKIAARVYDEMIRALRGSS